MTYDIIIRNGRVVDGTGVPAFNADVGIRNGKIAEIGKLRGTARREIDAKGQVVAPGFIDSHTHLDAQMTWDPLGTFSCYHGATTVIMGNCSLGIAPVRPGTSERLAEFLSFVEAIPMETLRSIDVTWESWGEYMNVLGRRLGLNVASLVGHTPIRFYVMGQDSQGRDPTADEIRQMQDLVRDAMDDGALGLSFSMSVGHFDPQGIRIPSCWAKEDEIFALCEAMAETGAGVFQTVSGREAEEKSWLLSRIVEKTGRPFFYSTLAQALRDPDGWKKHIQMTDETVAKGIRAIPQSSPVILSYTFDMHNCQWFKGVPSWRPVQILPDAEKLTKYSDSEFRRQIQLEAVDKPEEYLGKDNLGANWPDNTYILKAGLTKNKSLEGLSLRELGEKTGKGVINAFFDLIVEENLDTTLEMMRRGADREVMSQILNYPNALIGLSDAGAHVQFLSGYGYSSILLGHWVRKQKIMTVEAAVKKLTFDIAHAYGIYDRGLLQPGMAADVVIFDPDTIRALPHEKVSDLPGGAWRIKEMSEGVLCTIVNGQVLIENGQHTGALPGQVIRNAKWRERQEENALKGKATA